jgi:hypothetical protein
MRNVLITRFQQIAEASDEMDASIKKKSTLIRWLPPPEELQLAGNPH